MPPPRTAHLTPARLRRRDLLRFAAIGAAGAVVSGMLAACGESGSATATTAPTAARSTVGSTAPAGSATTGASGTNTPAAITAASGAVTFMVWGDPAEKTAYTRLTDTFNMRQSGVRVTLAHVPDQSDYLKRLAADFAANTPADIVLLNYRRFGAYAAKNALEPVGPYLAASALLKQADFYPEVIAAFSRGGTLVGIPQNVSSLQIYYNKALFDAARLPYPQEGWTWDDFLQTARALTDGKDQYGVGIDPQLIRLAPFVWQNGGDIVDNVQNPAKLTLDRAESIEAMQWFVDLQVRHKVVPDAVGQSAENDESRFLNGRTAMFFDSRRVVPTLREITAFDWDIAPLPVKRTRATILHSDAYFLTAASRNKAAAFAFMEYANAAEGQTFIARTGRTVPSLRAVAESPVFLEPEAKPRRGRVFLDAIPTLRLTINIDTTEQIEGIVNAELKRAFYGQASVAEAAATATRRTAALFRR